VTGPYATEDAALKRADGTYSLTYDPGFTVRGL
jgi:hypothetical protein